MNTENTRENSVELNALLEEHIYKFFIGHSGMLSAVCIARLVLVVYEDQQVTELYLDNGLVITEPDDCWYESVWEQSTRESKEGTP